MNKLKALFEKYRPFIAALAKSRAIQGIVATAIGTVIAYAKAHLPESVIDVAGDLITASAASLQAGGLGWAFYGRMKAQGPIPDTLIVRSPSALAAEEKSDEDPNGITGA